MLMLLVAVAAAAAPAAEAPACPATFNAFAGRFRADAAFQKAQTAPQLVMTHVDPAAEPEPQTVERTVPRAKVEFPVIASRQHMAEEGVRMFIAGAAGRRPSIVLRKADSDFLMRYRFVRTTDCWQLVRIDDESL